MFNRLAIALALLGLMSGCATGTEPQEGVDDPTTSSAEAAATQTGPGDSRPADGTDNQAVGQIDNGVINSLDDVQLDLLLNDVGLKDGWSSQDALLKYAELQQQAEWAAEELIATCMQAEGFEYTPETGHRSVVAMIDPELEIGTRSWAEHYGFAASTMIVVDNGDLPEGIVGDRTIQIQVGDLDEQPNEQYRLSLSQAEDTAYQNALNREGGCTESAWSTVNQDARFTTQQPTFALGEDETLHQRVTSDQRWIDYEASVQRCMAGEGIDYRSTTEYIETVMTSLMADLLNDPTVEYESKQWYDILRQAQQEERRVATTLYDCDGDPAARAARLREILSTYPLS